MPPVARWASTRYLPIWIVRWGPLAAESEDMTAPGDAGTVAARRRASPSPPPSPRFGERVGVRGRLAVKVIQYSPPAARPSMRPAAPHFCWRKPGGRWYPTIGLDNP